MERFCAHDARARPGRSFDPYLRLLALATSCSPAPLHVQDGERVMRSSASRNRFPLTLHGVARDRSRQSVQGGCLDPSKTAKSKAGSPLARAEVARDQGVGPSPDSQVAGFEAVRRAELQAEMCRRVG